MDYSLFSTSALVDILQEKKNSLSYREKELLRDYTDYLELKKTVEDLSKLYEFRRQNH